MKKGILFIVILAVFSSAAYSQSGSYVKYELKNGLTVILCENHDSPNVFGEVVVKAGSVDDPDDASGLAHYLEHMLFKGTENMGTESWEKEQVYQNQIIDLYDQMAQLDNQDSIRMFQDSINAVSVLASQYIIPNEMDKLLRSIGSTGINAGTSYDQTVFYNTFPSSQLENWLNIYSNRFQNVVFRGFQAELEVVYEEKNMYSDSFFFSLFEQFLKQAYKEHPYGQRPLIGTTEHLKKPQISKIYDFYNTYYVPNNMALILVGDFNTDIVMKIIEKEFSTWQPKEIKPRKVYNEVDFEGREFVEMKMSPIKIGAVAYRSITMGQDDEIAMEIINSLLSNSNGTGFYDKMMQDGQILAAQAMPFHLKDYGLDIFLFIPKVVGQSFEDGEKLIFDGIDSIKAGAFTDEQLEAIKLELYKYNVLSMEDNENLGNTYANYWANNLEVSSIWEQNNKLMKLTKEDIIQVANRYYSENYLVLNSKMGFPSKDKLEKPSYEAVGNKDEKAESVFATEVLSNVVANAKIKPIDFEESVQIADIFEGSKLYYVQNEENDIFTAKIKFGVGEGTIINTKYLTYLLSEAYPAKSTADQFRTDLSKLGCSLSFYSTNSYVVASFNGIDSNFNESLILINQLLANPIVDDNVLTNLVDETKMEEKMEKTETSSVAEALFNYVIYGDLSPYINRMTSKELKKVEVDSLLALTNKVLQYQSEIHYCGSLNFEDVSQNLQKNFEVAQQSQLATTAPFILEKNTYTENTVFFVNKKKSRQSNIYFYVPTNEYDSKDLYKIKAFNSYFGGAFSGLVMQEIREYRSLAYTSYGYIATPPVQNGQTTFIGYIGTQSDKTLEAIEVYYSLLRDMPIKEERIQMIRNYLVLSSASSTPEIRDLSEKYIELLNLSYTQDPIIELVEEYKSLSFSDIQEYYQSNIQTKPIICIVVGDKKNIDIKELEKYGEIIEIKEKDLFN